MGLTHRFFLMPADTGTALIVVSCMSGSVHTNVVASILMYLGDAEYPLTPDWSTLLAKDVHRQFASWGYLKSVETRHSGMSVDIIADLYDPVMGMIVRWVYTMYRSGFALSELDYILN